jgi:hypothetical protein
MPAWTRVTWRGFALARRKPHHRAAEFHRAEPADKPAAHIDESLERTARWKKITQSRRATGWSNAGTGEVFDLDNSQKKADVNGMRFR